MNTHKVQFHTKRILVIVHYCNFYMTADQHHVLITLNDPCDQFVTNFPSFYKVIATGNKVLNF